MILVQNVAAQIWLSGLLTLWGMLLFGGFLLGRTNREENRRMPTWTRIGSSLALVIAAWVWVISLRESSLHLFSLLIAVGMTLGWIGDLFLAKLLPFAEPTLAGIGAFGLGHIAYITAMVTLGNQLGLTAPLPRFLAPAIWLVVGFVGWYLVVYYGRKPTPLHVAALPYALLLAGMAGVATGLAAQAQVFIPLAIGSGLFFISDMLIAAELFSKLRFPLLGDVVWLTYGPAQMLIVFSVNSALALTLK